MSGARTVGGVAQLALLACALTVACSRRPESGVDSGEHAAIQAVLEEYYGAFDARDWDAYGAVFWPGAVVTTVWRVPGEREDRVVATTVEEFMTQVGGRNTGNVPFEQQMIASETEVFHNLAQAWVRTRVSFGAEAGPAEWVGVDAITLLKHGGEWKIAAVGFTNAADESAGG